MNSIIFKGVSSTTLDGLLICELPPISKPAMRTRQTAIDGRDGAVIEELGYSPYNKPIVVGLYGQYDINKIIKYFSGEGEVVFSNEPDKVYKATIVDKIDFERLVRYRKAKVTFLVQPFKYKKDEAMKETETATASGTSIVLNESGVSVVKSIDMTESAEIRCNNKNLFVHSANTTAMDGLTYTVNDDKSITIKGTASARSVFYLIRSEEKRTLRDGTYTLSVNANGTSGVDFIFEEYTAEGAFVKQLASMYNGTSKTSTFTVSNVGSVASYIRVYEGATVDITIYLQLEKGTVASGYVKGQESVASYNAETKTTDKMLLIYEGITYITNSNDAEMSVEYFKHFEVFNEGLEESRPLMRLKGSGTVEISVNGVGIFSYTFPEGENEVYIDSEKEDAYLGSVLKNRNMNGEFPVLIPKTNKIEWSGNVESIEILPRSRWL